MTTLSMLCPLCSHEFVPSGLACHTGCPLGSRCNLICCPQCGYQIVDASRSRVAGWLRRLMPAKEESTAARPQTGATAQAVPLTHIAVGATVEVRGFAGLSPQHLARFSVFGLAPGAEITLAQRYPAPVIRVGETELAMSAEIAACIQVLPPFIDN